MESRPDRMAIVRHSDKVEHWPDRIATVRHPGAHGGSRVCSYLDMWSGRPPMVYPDALSGYTSCMDSKELSSISYCFGDQKAIKTPKLNTFFIRIDCKGP